MKKVIILLLTIFSIFLFYGCNQFDNSGNSKSLPELKEVGIAEFDQILQQYKGKVVLVNFFASWCPPCRAETPEFVETYNKLKDKDFVILAFSIDDDLEKAKRFVVDYKIPYPVFHAKRELEQKMGVTGVPTNIFYDKNGNLFQAITGQISSDFIIKIFQTLNK